MRGSKSINAMLWFGIPILTTLNQACIKMLAERMKDTPFGMHWLAEAMQTPWALCILLFEVLSFVLWMAILAHTSISKAAPITAISYFSILLMSWTLFKEPIMPLQIVGSALILTGVWLISTATPKQENDILDA
jgi:drug/metabolite transporter (DMT)-like permease